MFLRRSRIGRKSISLSFYQPSIDFNRPDRNTTNLRQTTGTSQIFTSSENQTSSEESSQNQLGGKKPARDIYIYYLPAWKSVPAWINPVRRKTVISVEEYAR